MIELLTGFCFGLLGLIGYLFHKLKSLEKEHGFILMELTAHRDTLSKMTAQPFTNPIMPEPTTNSGSKLDNTTSYIG